MFSYSRLKYSTESDLAALFAGNNPDNVLITILNALNFSLPLNL